MSALQELLKKNNRFQLVATVVLAIYIISGVTTSPEIAAKLNTSIGHIIVILVVLALFAHTNLILGIVIIVAGYELIRRSHPSNTKVKISHFKSPLLENFSQQVMQPAPIAPASTDTETKSKTQHMHDMQPTNQDMLEVEIVNSTPKFVEGKDLSHPSYNSIQCDTHDAAILQH